MDRSLQYIQERKGRNMMETEEIECPICDGEGRISGHECPICNGEGKIERIVSEQYVDPFWQNLKIPDKPNF